MRDEAARADRHTWHFVAAHVGSGLDERLFHFLCAEPRQDL
jgi:hypothetical protein